MGNERSFRGGLGKVGMGQPTPDTDYCPQFTKFINDMGDLYARSTSWHRASEKYITPAGKKKALSAFAHYFSDAFLKVLYKELGIPE